MFWFAYAMRMYIDSRAMNFSKPPAGYPLLPRRALTLAAALLCLFLLPAVAAQADTASTLTIVGTSDVSDSGLVSKPDPASVLRRPTRSSPTNT